MFRPKSFLAPGLALALALTLGVGSASADLAVQTFTLTDSNLGSGFTGPFATVKVDLVDTTHATLTYDSLTNGGYTYLLVKGGGTGTGATGANISGGFTVSSITGTAFQTGAGALSNGGSGQLDGFGDFTQTVSTAASGPANAYTEIVVKVTATSGTTWTSITGGTNPLLTLNNKGEILAVGIGALATGGTSFTTTGFASGATVVPEPSTLALAGLGTIGFLAYGLRRRPKN